MAGSLIPYINVNRKGAKAQRGRQEKPANICDGKMPTAVANTNLRSPFFELMFSALPLRLRAFAVNDFLEFS
jgi:hypothetical protein